MRPPLLVVLAVGRRRYWLPLLVPVVVLWPFVVPLRLAAVAGCRLTWRYAAAVYALLEVLGSLPGLRIEVARSERCRFLLWIV